MTDRFADGAAGQQPRPAAPSDDRARQRLRPDGQGLVPRRRPRRPAGRARLPPGPRRHGPVDHPAVHQPLGAGRAGRASAGYHGYWQVDYTQIDPHLGTNAEMTGARRRRPRPGHEGLLRHRPQPHRRRHRLRRGHRHVPQQGRLPVPRRRGRPCSTTATTPAATTSPQLDPAMSFPYIPTFATPADATVKQPAWLNDPTHYHNRGNSTFVGENSLYGDFFGLDDLFTEQPAVVDGMIDIHTAMIDTFDIDGFRVDTVKHVNDELWEEFVPAIQDHAAAAARPTSRSSARSSTATRRSCRASRPSCRSRRRSTSASAAPSPGIVAPARRRPTRLRDLFADDDWFTDTDSNALRADQVRRQPRHRAHRRRSQRQPAGAAGRRAGCPRPARPGPQLHDPRHARRLLRRRAGLHRRRRRPGRPPGHDPVAGGVVQRRRPHRHGRHDGRRQLRPDPPAVPGDQPSSPPCAATTRPCARAPSCTATARRRPGIYAFSRIDRAERASSTSSPSTTARPPTRRRSAPTRPDATFAPLLPAGGPPITADCRRHDHHRGRRRSTPSSTAPARPIATDDDAESITVTSPAAGGRGHRPGAGAAPRSAAAATPR